MSVDFVARAMASMAAQRVAAVDLFINIGNLTIDDAVSTIVSGGYSVSGQGAAVYVSDGLATASLASTCPRFCKVSSDGRYWRAQAIDGLVPVWAGGAIGWNSSAAIDYAVNHRPAIAEALAYKALVGAAGLAFDKAHYSIWCPLRTYASDDIHADQSGVPFVITEPTVFRAAPQGSAFHRRSRDGSDPAVYADTQQLAQNSINNGNAMPWRGGMFLLKGVTAAPSDYAALASLKLKGDWQLLGGLTRSTANGIVQSGSPAYYTLNADGSGWDVTDKAIWCEQDRYTGDVVFDGNIRIDGFRGELLYQGGVLAGSVYQFGRLELSNTDGDGLNPGPYFSARGAGGEVLMEDVYIHHAYQALEGTTGWSGHARRLRIEDCARANGLWAGTWSGSATEGTRQPSFGIDSLHVERSGTFTVFRRNIIGRARVVDSAVSIGAAQFDATDVEIGQLSIIIDRGTITDALTVTSSSAVLGWQGTYKVRVRHLHVDQTPYAKNNGLKVINPVNWMNSLGDHVFIDKLTGVSAQCPYTRIPSSVVDFHVGFGEILLDFPGSGYGSAQNVQTTSQVAYTGPMIYLSTTTNGNNFQFALPSMTGKLPRGSRFYLYNPMGAAVLTIGKSTLRFSRRQVINPNQTVRVEWDGFLWKPIDNLDVVAGTTVAALLKGGAAIPANDVSDEVTATLNGATTDMKVSVSLVGGGSADALPIARVSAPNTVALRVKNLNPTTPLTPGSQTYAFACEYVS